MHEQGILTSVRKTKPGRDIWKPMWQIESQHTIDKQKSEDTASVLQGQVRLAFRQTRGSVHLLHQTRTSHKNNRYSAVNFLTGLNGLIETR